MTTPTTTEHQDWTDRQLLEALWCHLMTEDGDPIWVPTEPEDFNSPEHSHPRWGGFDLRPVCGDGMWDELNRRLS